MDELPALPMRGLGVSDARALLLGSVHGPLDAAVADQIITESHGNDVPVRMRRQLASWCSCRWCCAAGRAYSIFLSVLEVALLLLIVWFAWNWLRPAGNDVVAGVSGLPEHCAGVTGDQGADQGS